MQIGLGCVDLGSSSSGRSLRSDVRLVEAAVDEGVTVFDTADVYGNGASERVLGRALRSRRSGVFLATKGGYTFRERSPAERSLRRIVAAARRQLRPTDHRGRAAPARTDAYRQQDFSPAALRRAVDDSLRRLATDHLDLYQLHGPHLVDPTVFEKMQDLVACGKVRRFGMGAEAVDEAVAWIPIDGTSVVQLPFGVLDPDAATSAFPLAQRHGTEIWARGVLGGGLLGLVGRDPDRLRNDPKWPVIEGLRSVAARFDLELDHLAVGFVRSFAEVSTMLIGTSSRVHLARNIALMTGPPLDDEVMSALRAVVIRPEQGRRT